MADRARADTRTDGKPVVRSSPPTPPAPRRSSGPGATGPETLAYPAGVPDAQAGQARSRLQAREALQKVRETVPESGRAHFDQTMDTANRLIEADPRFRDVDYEQVAQQALIRGQGMSPEAAAALALNYQGHRGARVTPEALAHATNLSPERAASAVNTGWDAVKVNPGDVHNGGAGAPRFDKPKATPTVEEFNPETPKVAEFDPTADTDPKAKPPNARDATQRSREEAEAARYANEFAANAERSKREAVDIPEEARRQHVAEAEAFGRFTDSWELNDAAAAQIVNPEVRKLIPGDADYLGGLMSGNEVRVVGPDGNVVFNGTVKPSQETVCGEVINNYVVDILNSPPGEFPRSIEHPEQLIEIYPDGTMGDGGHHRMIAAVIASRLTGRPVTGGPNAIIPPGQIRVVPDGGRQPGAGWRLRVDPPNQFRAADIDAMRDLAVDFRSEARSAGDPEVAGALTRQAANLDWQADLLQRGADAGRTELQK